MKIKDKVINILMLSLFAGGAAFVISYLILELSKKYVLIITISFALLFALIWTFKYIIFSKEKTQKVIQTSTIKEYNYEELPEFKYLHDSSKSFKINKDYYICECCGKISKYIYDGMIWAEEDVEVLCPECIKTGKASKKYDGEFNIVGNEDLDKKIIQEVSRKTPSINTWQDFEWIDCCDDLCQLYGILKWDEVVSLGIEKEITEAINSNDDFPHMGIDLEELKSLTNDESINLIVFKCFHCNKFYVIFDFD